MVGQYGTHVDPPAHVDATGTTMDKIPLKQMILLLVVLDDTPFLARDSSHAFSLDDLMAWEKERPGVAARSGPGREARYGGGSRPPTGRSVSDRCNRPSSRRPRLARANSALHAAAIGSAIS